MDIRYYLVCSRFEALVASQLPPEQFGLYMAVGTKKLAHGPVIFFEVDRSFDRYTDRFNLNEIEEICVPHEDGSPKRSKYVAVYRVMEYVPLGVYRSLYLTTSDGRLMRLEECPYDSAHEATGVNLYQEMSPLTPLVVSGLPPSQFAKMMTDPTNRISVPRLFFADMRLDRDETGRVAASLPYPERAHITECIREIEAGTSSKPTKTVSRTPDMAGFFRSVRRGFFLADSTGLKFYRFPTQDELMVHHAEWWRSASGQ